MEEQEEEGAWAVSCGEGGGTQYGLTEYGWDYLCHFYEKNSKRKPCSGAEGFCRITFGCKNLTRKADMLCPVVSTEETKKAGSVFTSIPVMASNLKGEKEGFQPVA